MEFSELSFDELPIEQKIRRSTLIVLTTYQADGDRTKSVVAEVLKQQAGVRSKYDIGAEYAPGSFYPSANMVYGKGEVVFFTDNPARMQESASYDGNDRIGGLGEMPLAKLRELIAANAK